MTRPISCSTGLIRPISTVRNVEKSCPVWNVSVQPFFVHSSSHCGLACMSVTSFTSRSFAATEIDPGANTELEGLYLSKGMYCTQCEAQGFRKITYWPDRPDVMARFRVRIEGDAPVLLVVGASELPYKDLLEHYHSLCERVGALPPADGVAVDHGRQRFLLFALDGARPDGPCTLPAMAWVDVPVSGATVGRAFDAAGWAFRDGVGLDRVEVTLDGEVVATAEYGLDSPGTAAFWEISTDPNHPRVGWSARVAVPERFDDGVHWLGLRLHGEDGHVEAWPEQPVRIDSGHRESHAP